MCGRACLWQPSRVLADEAAACPCLPHTELPPGHYAGWVEPRCRPRPRMWTPLRPPAGLTWSFHVAGGCWRYDQEVNGYRWLYAMASVYLWGCVGWICRICHKLWRGQNVRKKKSKLKLKWCWKVRKEFLKKWINGKRAYKIQIQDLNKFTTYRFTKRSVQRHLGFGYEIVVIVLS